MALSETVIIVGRIIIPRRIDAVSILPVPFPPILSRINGTRTTKPKKP